MHSPDSGHFARESGDPLAALCHAPRGVPVALLHSCGRGPSRWFGEPVDLCRIEAGAIDGALDVLARFLQRHRERAVVGWLGYDLGAAVEPLPRAIAEDFPVPLVHLVAFAREVTGPPAALAAAPRTPAATALRAHCTRAEYEARVRQVIEHIRAGDVFQANLTQPFSGEWRGDPRELFWRLCEQSPAPFAAYLESADGIAVLSSSPEEFLHVDGRRVRTRPIKGTRPRGADATHDEALLAELLASEKDLAELAMIVDLMRNDLGKVARTGSVRVGPFPEHGSFRDVHHLFATVTAELRDDVGIVDLLRATFPGGSITGAPKLRCMEILERLELVRRGVYTGAIGVIGPGERAHLNVAIRTMTVARGRVRFNVGGGVTSDSDPGAEFDETLAKARGMLRTLGVARAEEPALGSAP